MAAFFAIEPAWLSHYKVRGVHKDGRSLWVAAGLHAVATESDGSVEKRMLPLLCALAEVAPKRAAELVAAGLWNEYEDHYEIHDFLKYNQSKALREAQREKWRRAKAKAAGLPEESSVSAPVKANGAPRASLPGRALPTPKVLPSSEVESTGNGDVVVPLNPPTDEGRAEIAKIKAMFGWNSSAQAEEA